MTSYIICDVTTVLLKYGKYIEKLKLTVQAVHMQITMTRALLCNLKNFKSFALLLWSTVAYFMLIVWADVAIKVSIFEAN